MTNDKLKMTNEGIIILITNPDKVGIPSFDI